MNGKISTGRKCAIVFALTIGATLASVGSASVATAVQPRVTGKWNVTYGAPAVVKIRGNGHNRYTMRALTRIKVTGGSATCSLTIGTVLAKFSGKSPTYFGQHGLWSRSNCAFGAWTTLTMTLNGNDTIIGHLGDGETLTFTRFGHPTR